MEASIQEILTQEKQNVVRELTRSTFLKTVERIGFEKVSLGVICEILQSEEFRPHIVDLTLAELFAHSDETEEHIPRARVTLTEEQNKKLQDSVKELLGKHKEGASISDITDNLRDMKLDFVYTMHHVRNTLDNLEKSKDVKRDGTSRKTTKYFNK
jgi:uncharacterized protein YbcI